MDNCVAISPREFVHAHPGTGTLAALAVYRTSEMSTINGLAGAWRETSLVDAVQAKRPPQSRRSLAHT